MKKARPKTRDAGMRDYYDFSGGVRGKYAKLYCEGTNVVVLDPDVAEVFKDKDSEPEQKFPAKHVQVGQCGPVGLDPQDERATALAARRPRAWSSFTRRSSRCILRVHS